MLAVGNGTSNGASNKHTYCRDSVQGAIAGAELTDVSQCGYHRGHNGEGAARSEAVKGGKYNERRIRASRKPDCEVKDAAEKGVYDEDVEHAVHVSEMSWHDTTECAAVPVSITIICSVVLVKNLRGTVNNRDKIVCELGRHSIGFCLGDDKVEGEEAAKVEEKRGDCKEQERNFEKRREEFLDFEFLLGWGVTRLECYISNDQHSQDQERSNSHRPSKPNFADKSFDHDW